MVLATFPFIWRLRSHPIQWEYKNVGVTYKLLEVLRYSHLSLSTETMPISISPPIREDFGQFSSQLDKIRPKIFWRCLSPPGVVSRALSILWFWKITDMQYLVKIYSLHIHLMEKSRGRESKRVHNRTWYAGSLESLHLLSVFLFNTSLYVSQFLIDIFSILFLLRYLTFSCPSKQPTFS